MKRLTVCASLTGSVLTHLLTPCPALAEHAYRVTAQQSTNGPDNESTTQPKTTSSVNKLRDEASTLATKGFPEEALERYKDSVCLAEILHLPKEEQREFLVKTAEQFSTPISPFRILHSRNETHKIATYLYEQALKRIEVKSPADLQIANSVITRCQPKVDTEDFDRIASQIVSLNVTSRDQKILQVSCLVWLAASRMDDKAIHTLMKAYEISSHLDPPDVATQLLVIERILAIYTDYRRPKDTKPLRTAVAAAFEVMKTQHVNPSTGFAIRTLMLSEDLATLVDLCEKQVSHLKKLVPNQPSQFASEYCDLGWAYLAAGRCDDAERTLKEISEITRTRRECEYLFELSQLSLAQTYLLKKEPARAKQILLSLRAFLDSPYRADCYHYGALGEAMLGDIFASEKNIKSAIACYEKAEEGLPILEQNVQTEVFKTSYAKSLLASDRDVLRKIATIYEQLGNKEKSVAALNNIAKLNDQATIDNRQTILEQKILAMESFPEAALSDALVEYKPVITKSEHDKIALAKKLNNVGLNCICRGLLIQADDYLRAASDIDTKPDPNLRNQIKRNQAWFLQVNCKYDESNDLLDEIITDDTTAEDESFVAEWLKAKNLVAQNKVSQATTLLAKIIDEWDPIEPYKAFYMHACCDQASIFVSQNDMPGAEACLKRFLIKDKTNRFGSLGLDTRAIPLTLLAYVQAVEGKISESRSNLRAANSSEGANIEHGPIAAKLRKVQADTERVLNDPNRALRHYYEAYVQFQKLPSVFASESEACHAELLRLLPPQGAQNLDLRTLINADEGLLYQARH